jgi:hypothetical protein
MGIIKPKHNLMLILLTKLSGNESPQEIYERTRFAWRTKLERAQNVDFVIAHNSSEEILAIFKPEKWLRGDDKIFNSLNKGSFPNRIGFIGELASDEIQEIYSEYSTPARKRGAANPVRYIELDSDDDVDLDASRAASENDLSDSEGESDHDESISAKKHSYLAGVSTADESLDSILETAYEFVETAYYKFTEKQPVYLVVNKKNDDGIEFLGDINHLSLVKLYEGCYEDDDPEPNKDDIRGILEKNSDFKLFDDGYLYLWFLFEFPEEDEDQFEEPGSHWEDAFYQLNKDFDGFAMVGYHSEIKENIWQQWCNGEFDEGAISNRKNMDQYKGENLYSVHKVDLKCLNVKNFTIK